MLLLYPTLDPSLYLKMNPESLKLSCVISVKGLGMVVSSSHLLVPQVELRTDNYGGGTTMGGDRGCLHQVSGGTANHAQSPQTTKSQ